MRLLKFYVNDLFNQYDHSIDFPPHDISEPKAFVTMIYGENGIGKTTILEMLNGIMKLDFTSFRKVPFSKCVLSFSNSKRIEIIPKYENGRLVYLAVSFGKVTVKLKPDERGCIEGKTEEDNEEKFANKFSEQMRNFSFQFIDTKRMLSHLESKENSLVSVRKFISKKSVMEEKRHNLSSKVKEFIMASQVDYRKYFEKNEPELFEKILATLSEKGDINYNQTALLKRLRDVKGFNKKYNIERFGIVTEKWDYNKITAILKSKKEEQKSQALATLNVFLEVLETRSDERKLIAVRLLTFEKIVNSFFKNKTILLSENGFKIKSLRKQEINEDQLSSGEYNLLYLMVESLTTRRRGTVIAIDEPEMSMHISWQRRLVKALIQCASNANPQFVFATHSPDIAVNYENALVTKVL